MKKIDLLVIPLIFLIYLFSLSWWSVGKIYSLPQYNKSFTKANISQTDIVFYFWGKDIPNAKVQAFNSLVPKEEMITKENKGDFFKSLVTSGGPLLLFLSIITFITYLIFILIRKIILKIIEKHRNKILKEAYIKKYSVPKNRYYTKCTDGSSLNKELTNISLVAWVVGDNIHLVNRDFKNDIGLIQLNYRTIHTYSRFGDFYTSMNVSGGGSSGTGAALGYLIAGAAGAVIGSRNPITSNTTVHDKRETVVCIIENDEEKFLFMEPSFYDFLLHLIPNKESSYKAKNEQNLITSNSNALEEIKKLGELKDKGYINDMEFENMKKSILNDK